MVEQTYTILGEFPDMGHTPVFDFVDGLQTVLVKGFRHHHVFYCVFDDFIRIERVAEGRRHLPQRFAFLEKDSS